MRRILSASLRGHSRRFVAGGIAVVLSVAYVAAVLISIDSVRAGLEKALGAQYANADLVLTPTKGSLDWKAVRDIDGVAAVARSGSAPLRASYPGGGKDYIAAAAVPSDRALRWHDVVAGRLPVGANEVAISRTSAKDDGLAIGDRVELRADVGPKSKTLTVVGVASTASMVERADLFVPERTVAALAGGGFGGELLVRLNDGANASAMADRVAEAAGPGVTALTGPEQVREMLTTVTGGIDLIGGLLLGFAAIAVFVALLVVANTFTIMIAQRARELALFRCVGAAKNQVFGAVLVESAVLGLAFAAIGVVLGIGLAQLALRLVGPYVDLSLPEIDLVLYPLALLVPLLIGIVTTVLAAVPPARRATKVPPLAALRPEYAVRLRSKAGVLRSTLGGLLILFGGALLAFAMRGAADPMVVLVGAIGGAVSFLGVLLFGPILAPAVVRLFGLVARRAGVPGNVAVDNAIRNPRRTAATAAALLVGVTLISVMVVGAASSEATFAKALDEQYPMDLTVYADDRLPGSAIDAITDADGIDSVARLRSTEGRIGSGDTSGTYRISGVDPRAAADVLHDLRPVRGLQDGTVVLGTSTAAGLRLENGDNTTLTVGEHTMRSRVRVIEEVSTPDVLVTTNDLRTLAIDAPVTGLWAGVAPDVDVRKLSDDLEGTLGTVPNVELGGSVQERALYGKIADVLLLVSTALLAVAVAIALVGVGNTLSLSVLERTREHALLRALGLTRGQLRGTLAIEGLLLSGTAVLIGVVLGSAYGYLGTSTMLGGIDVVEGIEFRLPWGRLAWIVSIAIGAGLLASVLPAARAVRVHPASALGEE